MCGWTGAVVYVAVRLSCRVPAVTARAAAAARGEAGVRARSGHGRRVAAANYQSSRPVAGRRLEEALPAYGLAREICSRADHATPM